MTDTAQLRIAASWRYEDAIEPTFVARRFPFAQGRSIASELFVPGFPSADELLRTLLR